MGYNGYPVIIRTNGLIITRTYLNPDESGRDDKCTEVVMIDPNPVKSPENTVLPISKKSDNAPETLASVQITLPEQNRVWHSARDMRGEGTEADKYREWCMALYSGI